MLSFFKSITFFTRSQKRGIIILLILIGVVLCSEYIIPELLKKDTSEKEQLEQSQLTYPLKRFGQPEDIANLAIYLLSDASSWMTGSSLDISGGGEGILTLN